MLTLGLGCRVCASRPAVIAVLKRAFIQVMEICTVLLVLQLYRISLGRQDELVQCTFASPGYLEVSQPPKISNDGKQQLPENQVCPLKPASLCSGRQITVLRYNTLGTAAVSVSPDDCTKVRSPISLCNRSKCCLPSMMCSLGL